LFAICGTNIAVSFVSDSFLITHYHFLTEKGSRSLIHNVSIYGVKDAIVYTFWPQFPRTGANDVGEDRGPVEVVEGP